MSPEHAENLPPLLLSHKAFIVHNGHILLLQRSHISRYQPNLLELPGGTINSSQDPLLELKREVTEEAGLEIRITKPLVYTHTSITSTPPFLASPRLVIVSVCEPVEPIKVALSSEHQSFEWIPYIKACDMLNKLEEVTREVLRLLRLHSI